jgi:hypothetical protein
LIALGVGAFFARDYFIDDAQASCEGSIPLAVAAATAIEPAVSEVLGEQESNRAAAVSIPGTDTPQITKSGWSR